MKRSTASRATALAAVALALPAALGGCSGADGTPAAAPRTSASASGATVRATTGAGADTFGPGCSAVPTSGRARSTRWPPCRSRPPRPPATRCCRPSPPRVGEARLVDTLNSARGLTVLAPTDDAFARIPTRPSTGCSPTSRLLTRILRHHVIRGRLAPTSSPVTHKTLAGDTLDVEGSGERPRRRR